MPRSHLALAAALILSATTSFAEDRWSLCADEGARCSVPERSLVRYGASGRYVLREVRRDFPCTNAEFGTDPAPNVRKQCELVPLDGEWVACAGEGASCEVRRRSLVRFGVNGKYEYRMMRGVVDCSLVTFGVDPAPNKLKRCDVME